MQREHTQLAPPRRVLMGPGPSDVSDRVLQALGAPTVGHLDPYYLKVMNETRELLQHVFQTKNELTLAVSGTGMAGMEACVCNLIEPGDEMIVCINGVFGMRMQDVAERCGAKVHVLEADWGRSFEPKQIKEALAAHPRAKALGIVHAETSTGAHQPLAEIGRLLLEKGVLFVVDTVTSLGGHEVKVDDWHIDACYAGTQKCLSCPPGLAPVTFSPRAIEAMDGRKTKVRSWYLDMSMIRQYWGDARVYHHTAPVNMTYALREALMIIAEEGLEKRIARHAANHAALRAGLEALGLTYIPERSLATLNCVRIPDGVDDAAVRGRLLEDYGIEIGGGLGVFKGRAWRIGLMGTASTRRNVLLLLGALGQILKEMGACGDAGAGVDAAVRQV